MRDLTKKALKLPVNKKDTSVERWLEMQNQGFAKTFRTKIIAVEKTALLRPSHWVVKVNLNQIIFYLGNEEKLINCGGDYDTEKCSHQ
jgi:hypothetical protein